MGGADALHPLVVDLDRGVHVRARGERLHHVLGGAAADVVERDHLVARAPDVGATGAGAGAGAAAGGVGAAGAGPGSGSASGRNVSAGAAGAGAGAGAPWVASSTSLRVMRPPGPLPWSVEMSSPRSATSRRTIGDVKGLSAPDAAGVSGSAAGSGAGSGARARVRH